MPAREDPPSRQRRRRSNRRNKDPLDRKLRRENPHQPSRHGVGRLAESDSQDCPESPEVESCVAGPYPRPVAVELPLERRLDIDTRQCFAVYGLRELLHQSQAHNSRKLVA